MKTTVTLSLISHTNVGKTTLARTLLRQDVGEVLDQAHVTEESSVHVLIEDDHNVLRLWDTPGFGDTRRLMTRLLHEREPLGWLLHQVWDRITDRPLYCSQRAIKNVRDEADVVLYLVNAAERPDGAGYVPRELEILTWMQRPVLVLLNQLADDRADVTERWSRFLETRPIVKGVLSLDAFSRCWTEEDVLLHGIAGLLAGPTKRAMDALAREWNRRNLDTFRRCAETMAHYLAATAVDRQLLGEADGAEGERRRGGVLGDLTDALKATTVDRTRGMAALNGRLDEATAGLMQRMIALHGLTGASAATIEQRVRDFQVQGKPGLTERTGAVAGAVVTGALGGLAADALTGGLSLGGGMIAGGILGAIGGSALAKGYRILRKDARPSITWTPDFLDQLFRQVVLRYLAIAHYGRGRGRYRDIELPEHWNDAVARAVDERKPELDRIWYSADDRGPDGVEALQVALERHVQSVIRTVLLDEYPHARELL